MKADERVRGNLLNKVKFELKSKQGHIKSSKKTEGRLSSYKFKLRPINGKDVSTIEKELTFRKLEKRIGREEKDQRALVRRERLEGGRDNVRSISNLGSSRLEVSRF